MKVCATIRSYVAAALCLVVATPALHAQVSEDPTVATAQLLAEVAPALGWSRGAPEAAITVVEFSDGRHDRFAF